MTPPLPSLDGAEVCPHCGATATIEPSPSLRWRCAVCGGGRVPGVAASALGASAVASLVSARRGRAIELGAEVFAIVLLVSALSLGVIASIAFAQHVATAGVALVVIGALAAVGAATLRAVARRNGRAWREALDDAWAEGAARIAAAHGNMITAPALAEAMRVPPGDAEAVLSRLSAKGARVSIDENAELRYRVDAKMGDPLPAGDDGDEETKEQAR